NWAAGGNETAVLQAKLISHGEPAFSHRPTACIVPQNHRRTESDDNSPEEDAFDCQLRLHAEISHIQRKLSATAALPWSSLHRAMQRIIEGQRQALSGGYGVLALEGGWVVTPMQAREDIERRQILLVKGSVELSGTSRFDDSTDPVSVIIEPIKNPWG